MLVKQMMYGLCFWFFIVSIFNLLSSIINKNREASRYVIALSSTYILYMVIWLKPGDSLHLDTGWELLNYFAIFAVSGILFITSIIVAATKRGKLKKTGNPIKYKIAFVPLLLLPIFWFCFSFFREVNYINNSKLVLLCSEGEKFNKKRYAYAVSDNYSKMITIGGGDANDIKKYLPSSFYDLNGAYRRDEIKIGDDGWIESQDDRIIIFENDEMIFEINLADKIPNCYVEGVFYKNSL